MAITKSGTMINPPGNLRLNDIGIFHTPNESASPPVAFVSASGITILGSALSAYSPPRALFLNGAVGGTTYKLYPFTSNIPNSLTSITVTQYFPGYIQGSFNRVTNPDNSELASLSSAYFVW